MNAPLATAASQANSEQPLLVDNRQWLLTILTKFYQIQKKQIEKETNYNNQSPFSSYLKS